MQVDKLINTVIDDLKKVSESEPNERLPKERTNTILYILRFKE